MKSYSLKFKIIFALLIVILIFSFSFFIFGSWSQKNEKITFDAFAKCLTEKGAIMYGTYWCPHCKNEKNAFGDSFQFVNYVECTENPNECLAKGIEGYPTWIFPDGKRLIGEQGITKLQEVSGCPL